MDMLDIFDKECSNHSNIEQTKYSMSVLNGEINGKDL